MLNIISLGAGVQSSTMALMAAHGEIEPMPDCAIFADTGWEPKAVYEHLEWLMSPNVLPFPVSIVSHGNLKDDLIAKATGTGANRFASVPFYTENGGMGRRQCTKEYKLYPIRKAVREIVGKPYPARIEKGAVRMWIGISTDEAQRMKPSTVGYIENHFPLVDAGMSRRDCLRWMERHDYPVPPKSSCLGCPFHNDAMWRDMRDNSPGEWAETVAVDKIMRDGGTMGMKQRQYMHRDRVPLDEVDLRTDLELGQPDLFGNECEGMCGV